MTRLAVTYSVYFALALAASAVCQASAESVADRSPRAERWSDEKINAWYGRHPWLVGCNFIPSTAINQVEMWRAESFDPETIDRELSWAADLGFNTVRVYLHDIVFEEDPEGLLDRIDQYLKIADRHGIITLFVFFDDCWLSPTQLENPVPAPLPGVHNSGWLQSPGFELVQRFPEDAALQARLERYVTTVLRRFADDERILGWDLYNEPGNRAHQRHLGGERAEATIAESAALLEAAFRWAWAVNPSQPLTSGIWSWRTPDHPIAKVQYEKSDFITFHHYDSPDSLQKLIQDVEQHADGRPMICTEYMARTANSTFQNALPIFARHRIGAINWGLVAGKSNTVYPWSSWETPGPLPEPEVWFHDILRADGTPFREGEVEFIRELTTEIRAGTQSE